MARRTKDEAEKTRIAILDAAEKVFYKCGVACTSLEEIAKVAKVTRGAVYWHFKDKIEVCVAMTKRVFMPYEDVLEQLAAHIGDNPLNELRNTCCESLRRMETDKRRKRVVSILMFRCEYVAKMSAVMKRRNQCKDRMLQHSLTLLTHAEQLGQLSSRWTPRTAAMGLQAMMTGLIMGSLEGRKGFDLSESGIACLDAFFNSLRASNDGEK